MNQNIPKAVYSITKSNSGSYTVASGTLDNSLSGVVLHSSSSLIESCALTANTFYTFDELYSQCVDQVDAVNSIKASVSGFLPVIYLRQDCDDSSTIEMSTSASFSSPYTMTLGDESTILGKLRTDKCEPVSDNSNAFLPSLLIISVIVLLL